MTDSPSSTDAALRFLALGDAAVTVEFGQQIHPAINAQTIAFAEIVRAQNWDDVFDVVPTYRSVTVHIDARRVDLDTVIARLRRLATARALETPASGIEHTIPVLYGGASGPDLEDVAAFAQQSIPDTIRLHCSVVYRVYMLGFSPGFPYLGTVPEPIAMPRLATPRATVPAGSVGIAGQQTGIYPTSTPGGWRLIGRTPVALYRPAGSTPFLLHPGDSVRFVPIEPDQFHALDGPRHDDAH
jgi:inhibitor of KinA